MLVKVIWRKKWQPISGFLPQESHGQRSLEGYSQWYCKESDVTERLTLRLLVSFKSSISLLIFLLAFYLLLNVEY